MIDLDQIHEVDRQVDIKRALDHAIETNSVEIFMQPLIECSSGTMIGAEVLARIRNEEGRIIPPGVFIEIAEQNGQINRLGAQVFEKACRFIAEGNLSQCGLRWLNVNLSPIQCMKKDLAVQFSDVLKKYAVNPEQIHLEITEASMVDLTILEKQIETLRGNGFQFALDDYGAGYSNLTRVKHYPFINIKLDMEVVWDYYREKDALLPALVQAFKKLNFTITAEGIETREMGEELTAIGCDYLQGYYYSKPLPEKEFIEKYAQA
jgi:EAL domain-containing protein (putative c-di-GMP-specific phosphodiesterase class I)